MYLLIVLFFVSCGIHQDEVIAGPGTTTTSFGSIQGDITSNQDLSPLTKVQLFQENNLEFKKLLEVPVDSAMSYQFDSLKLGRYLVFAYNQQEIQNTSILEITSSSLDIKEPIVLQKYQTIQFKKPKELEYFYSMDTKEAEISFGETITTYIIEGQSRVWAKFYNQEKKQYSIEVEGDSLIMKAEQDGSEVIKLKFEDSYGAYTP